MSEIGIDARMVDHSGIGRYLRQLVPRVTARNPDLRFVLLGDRTRMEELGWSHSPNVTTRAFGAPIYSVREQISREGPGYGRFDLFWSPHYNVPALYGGRLLTTVHDVCHLALAELFPGVHRRLYARGMFELVRRKSDAILVPSEFTRREFEDRVGAPTGATYVIPEGVDASFFRDRGGPESDTDPFLLYVGDIRPHKNVPGLLRGFRLISPAVPHRLVLAGEIEVPAGDEVFEIAEALGPRVEMAGFVPEARLKRYLRRADGLILPSLYEGFGLPALEAMASGCPVAASSSGALPEVCGDAALYFDPEDPDDIGAAMLRLATDAGMAGKMRRRGLERAATFDWDRTAREISGVLRSLLEPTP